MSVVFDLSIVLLLTGLLIACALGRSAADADKASELEAIKVYDQRRETQERCACGVLLLAHETYFGACDRCMLVTRVPQETRR